jgi:quercetin dioxygenase-like cupin family protein
MRLAPILVILFFTGFPVHAGNPPSAARPAKTSAVDSTVISSNGRIQTRVLLRSDTTWVGHAIAYPATDSALVTAIEVTIQPGGETGWHWHPFPGYAYILEGTLTLEAEGGKLQVFHAGESFAEAVHARHNGRNLGNTPLKLVGIFTGEKGKAISVKVGTGKR